MSSPKCNDHSQKEALFFLLNDYRNSPDHSNTPFSKWEHTHGFHWDKNIHIKNIDLYIYYFWERMLNWFLAASKGFLQLFYASVEGLMLIYVVYWILDLGLVGNSTRKPHNDIQGLQVISTNEVFYTAKLFQYKSFSEIFFLKNTKLKVVYVPIVFLNFNLNPFKVKGRKLHLNIRNIFYGKEDQRLQQAAQTGWVLILNPWRYSKPDSTKPWTTCSSWPCFEGSDNLQMVLSNSSHSVIPE